MQLIRIHSSVYQPNAFNPSPVVDPMKAGRFDSTTGNPAYLYAAQDINTAVDEVILRDIPFDTTGIQIVRRGRLAGKHISGIVTADDLALVDLRSARALGQLGQDTWLVHCDSKDYDMTRQWAEKIRSWIPHAAGFTWHSKRNPSGFAYVLFSPPTDGSVIQTLWTEPIDSGVGLLAIETSLKAHNVVLGP